jgi:hypothetical protein
VQGVHVSVLVPLADLDGNTRRYSAGHLSARRADGVTWRRGLPSGPDNVLAQDNPQASQANRDLSYELDTI